MINKRNIILIVFLVFSVFSLSCLSCNKNTSDNITSTDTIVLDSTTDNSTFSWNEYDEKLKTVAESLNGLNDLLKDSVNYEKNKQKIISELNDLANKANEVIQTNVPTSDADLKNKIDECMKNLANGAKNANEGINSDKKELLEKADEMFKQGVNNLNSFLNNNSQ